MTLTNTELAMLENKKKNQGKWTGTVPMIMDLSPEDVKYLIDLRASGRSYKTIAKLMTEKYPRPDGKEWYHQQVGYFFRKYNERTKTIAEMSDSSIAKEATEEVINTKNTLEKINKLLNKWVDECDTQKSITIECARCGEEQVIKVFDSDKAVRIAHEMLQMVSTANKLSNKLPLDVKRPELSMDQTLYTKRMIDKLVTEGVLIVANPDKLHSFGL